MTHPHPVLINFDPASAQPHNNYSMDCSLSSISIFILLDVERGQSEFFAFIGYTGSQLQVKNFLSGFFFKYCHIFLLVFLSSPQTKRHPEIKKKLSSRPRTSFLIWYIFYRRWAKAQAKNPHNIESDNTMIAMASILFCLFCCHLIRVTYAC